MRTDSDDISLFGLRDIWDKIYPQIRIIIVISFICSTNLFVAAQHIHGQETIIIQAADTIMNTGINALIVMNLSANPGLAVRVMGIVFCRGGFRMILLSSKRRSNNENASCCSCVDHRQPPS